MILKNSAKRSFSYETKASVSFIQMSRTRLECPIMTKKRFLCESMFIEIDRQILILKDGVGEKFFL